MTQIEIFMMMYSLLLGLAMAGLLSNVGELLRGRSPPRWGVLVPLGSVVLFITLLGAFADTYAWKNVEMSLRSMGMPALAGVLYYLAAILSVPREHDGWDDLETYFMARKHLIFGCQLAAYSVLVLGFEVPSRFAQGIPIFSNVFYLIGNGMMMVLLAVPIVARRRSTIIASMIGMLVMLGIIYLNDKPVSVTLRSLWTMATGG